MSSLTLLQGIFPAKGWNPGLPHCRQILYQLLHQGSCPVSSVLTLCLQPCPSWGTASEANYFQENGGCADQVECWFGALGNYHCSRASALPFSPRTPRGPRKRLPHLLAFWLTSASVWRVPVAREVRRADSSSHITPISGPGLCTTEMEHSLAALRAFQEPDILEMLYFFPTEPARAIRAISLWLLPERG